MKRNQEPEVDVVFSTSPAPPILFKSEDILEDVTGSRHLHMIDL